MPPSPAFGRFLPCLTTLVLCLTGMLASLPARAQTTPPTLGITKHDSVSFSDTSKTLVDEWEVRVPQGAKEITLQLWSLQNGHLSILQTALAYFNAGDAEAAQTGRVYLLRARSTPVGKTGATMPVPGLGFRFPEVRTHATSIGGQQNGVRPVPRASVSLPGPLNVSVYTNETQVGSGIASNQPLALWVGQATPQASASHPLPFKAFVDANRAAATAKQTPLRPLLNILNQNNPKGDTLLVLIVQWEAAQAKPIPFIKGNAD